MLLPVATEAKEGFPESKLLELPELASFSVLTFITDVSALDAEVAEDNGSVESPNLKIGTTGDEGTAVDKTGLLLEAVEVDAVAIQLRVLLGDEVRLLILLLN